MPQRSAKNGVTSWKIAKRMKFFKLPNHLSKVFMPDGSEHHFNKIAAASRRSSFLPGTTPAARQF
jgi:hypothetical protein